MKWGFIFVLMAGLLLGASPTKDEPVTSPQAGERTYAQNYKDMVLATCIADAYRNDHGAAVDAGSSVSACS